MTPTQTYWKNRPVMYRVFDANGRLIYVGQSINLPARLSEHRSQRWWWKPLASRVRIQVFPSVDEARVAEKVAIQEETPAFNQMGYGNWRDNPFWTDEDHEIHRQWTREWILAMDTTEDYRQRMLDQVFPEEANDVLWAGPS